LAPPGTKEKKMATNLEMPRATTPFRVLMILTGLALLGGGALFALLGFWGVILLFGILGATTGVYTPRRYAATTL
jgi:uncharacterized membrane protein